MTDQVTDSNANLSEPPYASLQREVQRKLGKCMLRLQHYELTLKRLLASQKLSGPPEDLQSILDKKVAAISVKTLGTLIGEFTKEYIQPTLLKSGEVAQDNPGRDQQIKPTWLSIKFSMAMSTERHAEISKQLTELVELRNLLVHHLSERFDVNTESGCRGADLYLDDCYAKIDSHYLTLRTWVRVRDEALSCAAAALSSSTFWSAIDPDFKP